jgi:hypothetical protein
MTQGADSVVGFRWLSRIAEGCIYQGRPVVYLDIRDGVILPLLHLKTLMFRKEPHSFLVGKKAKPMMTGWLM